MPGDHRHEAAAHRGQPVFDLGRHRAEILARDWHKDIAEFIAALDTDPDLKGRIGYRCFKMRDGADYYHLASPKDDQVPKTLQTRDFFSR